MVIPISPPHGWEPGNPTKEPDVAVVCVTYNSAAVIEPLLTALPEALESVPSCRVVIVDNDSKDGTAALIQELAPWVTVVSAGSNVGYSGGINIALRECIGRRGTYILNPDAVPSPGSVARLLEVTESGLSIGIAVPRVLTTDGNLKFSLRREPTLLRAAGEALLGGHRAARFRLFGDMIRDPAYYQDMAKADWATGAAMFISRSVSDAIGDWDERFFLYSEETDYALRARDSGYALCLVPDATVVHPGGDMSVSPYLWSLVAVNRTRLYRKRHRLPSSLLFWSIVVANEAARSILGRRTHQAALRALLAVGPNPSDSQPTQLLI